MPKMSAAHLEARTNEILDAAEKCFVRKGLHQTTMHDICAEARLSPGAVYRYFKSKDDLIDAVAQRRTLEEMGIVQEAKEETSQALEALAVVGERFWAQFLRPDFEHWARLDIEIWPESLRNKRQQERVREQRAAFRSALAEICRLAVEQGTLRPDVDPVAMANLLMALYRGLQLHKAIDPEGVDTEEVLRILIKQISQPDLLTNAVSGAGEDSGPEEQR
ncbi:MAG: TetR/AcrR family transcriptional regulator [Dehalococcoidia bacterium]|nr:TetR/AcrR family transcriptional regulator [Dehalococcoidia bacterium]